MELTVCELFAGVGGFRLGLERTGWKTIFMNQWEPGSKKQDAFDCYAYHFPEFKENPNSNVDIQMVNDIPNHTLLVGGFPCQDYSVANSGAKGMEGKKGVLWWEIDRIIKTNNPPFILLENVDRLLSSPAIQKGRDFGIVLRCLCDAGYNVEWRVINAADYGFPQKRRRVFIFASKGKRSNSPDIIRDGFFGTTFPVDEVENRQIGNLPKTVEDTSNKFNFSFGNAGYLSNNGTFISARIVPLVSREQKNLEDILDKTVSDDYFISNESLKKWIYVKGAKKENRKAKNGFSYLYTEGAIPFPDDVNYPSRTILTSEGNKSPNRCTHVIRDPNKNALRRLTPTEVERLNGFPTGWTNIGMSESKRYFCMGNALVVGLIERMGSRLKKDIDQKIYR